MNTEINPIDEKEVEILVSDTKRLIGIGQEIVLKVAENVWKLRETLYSDKKAHKEFVSYCYKEFGLNSTAVSKYEKIGDSFYANGYTPDTFKYVENGIERYKDSEVVYFAAKLDEPTEEKIGKALTWSREDFKDDKSEQEHEPEWVVYCKFCGKSQERHPLHGKKD